MFSKTGNQECGERQEAGQWKVCTKLDDLQSILSQQICHNRFAMDTCKFVIFLFFFFGSTITGIVVW